MRNFRLARSFALMAAIGLSLNTIASAQEEMRAGESRAQQALEQNAEQGLFTVLVFYKANDNATKAMANAVEKGLGPRSEDATLDFVQISSPDEKPLVEKFAVSRAPMPLTLVVAPNGAVTGVFRKAPSSADIAAAFVTPTMTRCMKALQSGKIVLICVQSTRRAATPAAVTELQADPQFQDRIAAVQLDTQDSAEADFLAQLEIDAENSAGIATVMLAPPGVLVGKYPSSATGEEIAAALHEAGKCCDDENCKHNKAAGAKHKSTHKPSDTRRK
jgi:hypothetical protein